MLWRIFRSCYAKSASCSIACFCSVEAASLFCPLSLWKMLFQILLQYGPIGMKHMRVNIGSLFWLYRPLSTWMDFLLPPLRFNLSTALRWLWQEGSLQTSLSVSGKSPILHRPAIRRRLDDTPIALCISRHFLHLFLRLFRPARYGFWQAYYAEPPPRFRLCFGNCCGDQLPHVCRPVFLGGF